MKHADTNDQLTEHDVQGMLINPIYAVGIHPDLFGDVPKPLIGREQWVKANAHLIDEMGAEAYLHRLLDVLSGDFPRQPDERAGHS
jgi:hypothetical protein